jgi:outer membrane lipoprotein
VFPLVSVIRHHAWTAEEMRSGHPHVSFGLGVGFGSGGYRGGGVGIGVH